MTDLLDLWDYRRKVAESYRRVREQGPGPDSREEWRSTRDALFASHPQSPFDGGAREPRPFYPYDPAWNLLLPVEPHEPSDPVAVAHSAQGATAFVPIGIVHLPAELGGGNLTLYWLDTYGGGVFLPFRDGTSGDTTYGGGRYLLDTAKGADLGHEGSVVALDFNFAYHPSCVYDNRWSCPLAPPANRIRARVDAGERLP